MPGQVAAPLFAATALQHPGQQMLRTDLRPGARPGAFNTACAARHVASSTNAGQLPLPTISRRCGRVNRRCGVSQEVRHLRLRPRLAVAGERFGLVPHAGHVAERRARQDRGIGRLDQWRSYRVRLVGVIEVAERAPPMRDTVARRSADACGTAGPSSGRSHAGPPRLHPGHQAALSGRQIHVTGHGRQRDTVAVGQLHEPLELDRAAVQPVQVPGDDRADGALAMSASIRS